MESITKESNNDAATGNSKGLRWTHIIWIILATIVITAGATYWIVRSYIYAKDFEPVILEQKEEIILNKKLQSLGITTENSARPASTSNKSDFDGEGNLVPEAYTEAGASREVTFSERELNALLAKNTDLARKLAIDLSDNLMSAKLLVPVDPDFPVLGGKTIRVTSGLEVAYQDSKPIVILKGVSIMGVPLPNAWLGGLKNIDMVNEFGASEGFWKAFADGVDNIHVENGGLKIVLKQ